MLRGAVADLRPLLVLRRLCVVGRTCGGGIMRRGKHGGPDCCVTYRNLRVEDIPSLEKLQACILLCVIIMLCSPFAFF
jgi:hypothetical protein